eukprot:g3817.t1
MSSGQRSESRPWSEESAKWTNEWQTHVYSQTKSNIKTHFAKKRRYFQRKISDTSREEKVREEKNAAARREDRLLQDIAHTFDIHRAKNIEHSSTSRTFGSRDDKDKNASRGYDDETLETRRRKGKRLSMVAVAKVDADTLVRLERLRGKESIKRTHENEKRKRTTQIYQRLYETSLQKTRAVDRYCMDDSVGYKIDKVKNMRDREEQRKETLRRRQDSARRVIGALNALGRRKHHIEHRRQTVHRILERKSENLRLRKLRQLRRAEHKQLLRFMKEKRQESAYDYKCSMLQQLEDTSRRIANDMRRKHMTANVQKALNGSSGISMDCLGEIVADSGDGVHDQCFRGMMRTQIENKNKTRALRAMVDGVYPHAAGIRGLV